MNYSSITLAFLLLFSVVIHDVIHYTDIQIIFESENHSLGNPLLFLCLSSMWMNYWLI